MNWLLIALLGLPAAGALVAAVPARARAAGRIAVAAALEADSATADVVAEPSAGAMLTATRPVDTAPDDRRGVLAGTVAAALTLVAAVALYFDRAPAAPVGAVIAPWHQIDVPWVPALRLRFHVGIDGISYPLVVLTALLTLLCCLYTLARVENVARAQLLVALLLVVELGIVGVFIALDLVLFFVLFEVVLLPMYAIIAGWGGPDRRHASMKFVLYTLAGSVLLLVGVVLIVVKAGTGDMVALSAGSNLSRGVELTAFVLLGLAFAVKSPLWPLHTWLPDAHTEAPTVGSVILAGVLLKMGTYGLLRLGVGILPDAARRSAGVLGVLAVAAILVGSLVCLRQTELKRLIAYSSVGHMGFVLLGIASMTAIGFTAALIGNIAHGIITGLLFFLAGAIKRRGHTGDLRALGGLRENAPWLAGLLAFAAIASLGLPGLAGFWGEAFAVVGAISRHGEPWKPLAILAALGGALTAAYFLRLLRIVTHGSAVATIDQPGVTRAELTSWSPLVALALIVGVAPAIVLSMAYAPVAALALAVVR